MTRQAVSTASAPAAVGPYSQAIATDDLVFCSGQVGLDPATGILVEGGIEVQAERALANLAAVLDAAGCTFADVVKTQRIGQRGSIINEKPPHHLPHGFDVKRHSWVVVIHQVVEAKSGKYRVFATA